MKTKYLLVPFILGLGLALALPWALAAPSAPAAELHVCSSGCAYSSVQAAVDAANPGDVIKVAAGDYTDISARKGVTQVVYISKTVTIQGGYTTAFTEPPDPNANSTTLDAGGQGRVLYITGDISPTVEGLRITGGDADGLGGHLWGYDAGGGVCIITATVTVMDSQVFSNTALAGGGLYVRGSATLISNTIADNIAKSQGGGLYISGDATLTGNTLTGNKSQANGGGLYVSGEATLAGNTISDNAAGVSSSGFHSKCPPYSPQPERLRGRGVPESWQWSDVDRQHHLRQCSPGTRWRGDGLLQ